MSSNLTPEAIERKSRNYIRMLIKDTEKVFFEIYPVGISV